MKHVFACLATTTLVAGSALALATPAQASADLSLKGQAGRFVGTDSKSVGAGDTAQARWTNQAAANGQHAFLLEKSVETSSPSYAAAVVEGAEAFTVGDLGTIGFSVSGPCTGGSPRFNLYFDDDGDGIADGIAFYGCADHVAGTDGEWTRMSADALTPSGGYLFSGEPFVISADDQATSLSVLVDEQGTYYVDDVQVAGQTLGEPQD